MEPLEDRRLLAVGRLCVDADSTAPAPDGSSWATAYADLQDALDRAAALNTDADATNGIEAIWIADGVYTPSKDKHNNARPGDPRTVTFSMLSGVSLHGGFAGNEATLNDRPEDPDGSWSHKTVLSGDLAANDVPDNDTSRQENAYTVVYAFGLPAPLRLDALTITAGSADYDPSAPYSLEWRYGAGVYASSSDITITNSTLAGNSAGSGGGIYSSDGTLAVSNSTIVGNSAGGGIYSQFGTLTVTNSTIAGNSNGIISVSSSVDGELTLSNSIVCLNYLGDVWGRFDGTNNLLSIDPGFVRPPSAGTDGVWGTSDDDLGDLRLTDRSPAINRGDNLLAVGAYGSPLRIDLAGNPRIADGTVDIGAYEYQGPPAAGRETPSLVVSATHDTFDPYDGDITLREALYYCQSGIGDGTITFDTTLDGETITLAGSELLVHHPVLIDASALSSLTVDADRRSRVFRTISDATFRGLTITGGLMITGGSAARGGGILHNRGTLTVLDCTLVENSARSGGGIASSGTLIVANSTIAGNSATSDAFSRGGGINSNGGTLTVTNSTIAGNSANGRDSSGGGIGIGDGTLTVINSTIAGNSANGEGSDGGGIFLIVSNLTVIDSTLVENSAGAFGGGLFGFDGTLTLTDSTIAGNSAYDGGGIWTRRITSMVINSTLAGNSANHNGGGIYNREGTLTVTNSTLAGNSATGSYGRGGGIYSYGTLTVTNSTLARNSATYGGGINNNEGTLTLSNSIVYLNSANNISGSFAGSNNLLGIDPGFVRAPSAGTDGVWGTDDDDPGDLHLTSKSPAVNQGDNLLAVDAGGNPLATDLAGNPRIADNAVDVGAYEYQGPPAAGRETPSLVVSAMHDRFDLYDGDITLREAIHYCQSGIGDGTVTFDATLDGATITLAGSEVLIRHPVLIDASALSSLTVDADGRSRVFRVMRDATFRGLTIAGGWAGSGGGIYSNSTLTLTNSTITGNWAYDDGGGIHNDNGTLTVTNSTIAGNSTNYGDGGGIYSYRGTLTVTNSTITGNWADGDGGGICGSYGTLAVTNSTITGNSAHLGGGIYRYGGRSTLRNTIVAENAGWKDSDVYGAVFGASSYSLVGTTDSPIDPRFVRAPSDGGDGWGDNPNTPDVDEGANDDYGDLRLLPDSPAIDAGDNALLPVDEFDLDGDGDTAEPIPIDLAGNPRIWNGTVDMGAYEYLDTALLHPGDANFDGVTDLSDFNIWNANKFADNTAWATADFNDDGLTDLSDFNIWNAHKFTSAPQPAPVDAAYRQAGTLRPSDIDFLSHGLTWMEELERAVADNDPTDDDRSAVDLLLASYWQSDN